MEIRGGYDIDIWIDPDHSHQNMATTSLCSPGETVRLNRHQKQLYKAICYTLAGMLWLVFVVAIYCAVIVLVALSQ